MIAQESYRGANKNEGGDQDCHKKRGSEERHDLDSFKIAARQRTSHLPGIRRGGERMVMLAPMTSTATRGSGFTIRVAIKGALGFAQLKGKALSCGRLGFYLVVHASHND